MTYIIIFPRQIVEIQGCTILLLLQIINHFDFFLFIHFAMYLHILLYLDALQNGCTRKVKATYNLERREYFLVTPSYSEIDMPFLTK